MRSVEGELEAIREAFLYREPRFLDTSHGRKVSIRGSEVLSFSSNDYLGLARHPALVEAAVRASSEYGAGSASSRLISGGLPVHRVLEERAATHLGVEACVAFSSGYAAALGTLGAFLRRGDVVILDKLCHACLVDGARLSGAELRVFAHNDVGKLARLLDWALDRVDPEGGRVLVVTESVFSMDGDLAHLREVVELAKRAGAMVMVDEAHALGVFGEAGGGLVEHLGLVQEVDLRMAPLGKAAGAAGGLVAGSAQAMDLLRNRARSFVFSTSPPPAQAAAGTVGLEILGSAEGAVLRARLRERLATLRAALGCVLEGEAAWTPIVPVMVGGEQVAVDTAGRLFEEGIFVPAVRYPTVARGAARLRVSVGAFHEVDDIEALVAGLRRAGVAEGAAKA